ncbi:hypothetical protein PHET_07030 [Paragonimus heterotremus]|uniref:Trematode PH-like domain-containing protein n=1 Tax=Paragonimus heterotremus TaxID=100268 RepID=A0A8J4WQE7_9TREM|nr:hypothetical protein PHET_07030 [Paragonimus heterotremus]
MQTEAGQRIDRKSKQLLFHQCEVDTVKQIFLKPNEDFSQEGANNVFEKYGRKRQSKSMLFCLIDRMRFQKRSKLGASPFRRELTYREIKHFFVFLSNPGMFMLCTENDRKDKRAYEIYRCKPEDVSTICDLTYQASTDPQNILRDADSARQISIMSKEHTLSHSSNIDYVANGGSYNDLAPEPAQVNYMESMKDPAIQTPMYNLSPVNVQSSEHLPSYTLRPDLPLKATSLTSVVHSGTQRRNQVTGVYSYYEVHEPEKLFENVNTARPAEYSPLFDSPQIDDYQRPWQIPHDSSPRLTVVRQPIANRSPELLVPSPVQISVYKPNNYRPSVGNLSHPGRPRGRIKIEREFYNSPTANLRRYKSTQDLQNWGDSVTYLGHDPENGTNVTDNGPIYMYITRHESQQDLHSLRPDYGLSGSKFRRLSTFWEEAESNTSDIV